jgi:dTDP-4-dehydrorhamnose 3,5-epimerase-like enzyme
MVKLKRIELRDKTWADERGWGINPLEAAGLSKESLGNLHVVSIRPGHLRGNHYHTTAHEWLLTCGGPAKIYWRSGHTESISEVLVNGQEPLLFEIPPNVEHAIVNQAKENIYLLSFHNAKIYDTVRCTSLVNATEIRNK